LKKVQVKGTTVRHPKKEKKMPLHVVGRQAYSRYLAARRARSSHLGLSVPRIVAFTHSAPSEWFDRREWWCLPTGAKGKIQAW